MELLAPLLSGLFSRAEKWPSEAMGSGCGTAPALWGSSPADTRLAMDPM